MYKAIVLTLLVSGLAAMAPVPTAAPDDDPEKGKQLYEQTCVTCHGEQAEGNMTLNAPQLAGQQGWYLKRQIKNYKTGIRGTHPEDTYGAQMRPMAMTLEDDKAIDDIVSYLVTLEATPVERTETTGNPETGKTKYTLCQACHGVNGEGVEAMNGPRLTGQYDWYLIRQLQNFKAGIRGSDPKDNYGAQMRPMTMTLADEQQVKDVVAYIQTLK
jgi:cytochrome c oxidase subunit 2